MEISEIMTKRTKSILERLDERYTTEFRCSLNYTTPWELLAATMLSAQCTDERVNIVTKDLFVKYPDVIGICTCRCKGNGAGYPLDWILPQQGKEPD